MADLWETIKGWFRAEEKSSPNQPYIHELIERKPEETADFQQWKTSLIRRRLMDWLGQQYASFRVNPDHLDEALDFLHTPSSKGFVIHFFKTNYTQREATFLFDLCKERILEALNYKSSLSDVRTYRRGQQVETVQRHYLKPRIRLQEDVKINQQFGNINIELVSRNEKPFRLKLSATCYSDHLYQEGQEFEGLMQLLVQTEG